MNDREAPRRPFGEGGGRDGFYQLRSPEGLTPWEQFLSRFTVGPHRGNDGTIIVYDPCSPKDTTLVPVYFLR